MRIAFIGFGEAAQSLAASLGSFEGVSFSSYDLLFGTPAEAGLLRAASRHGVETSPSHAQAVQGADWVISAVTAAASLEAAEAVAGALSERQVFFDINSVSAARKVRTSEVIASRGALYVDMAVMAPVHPRGHRTPVLTAGMLDEATLKAMRRLEFEFDHLGSEVGAATSVKMVRSLFVKGLEAITVQTLLAAQAAGCFDRLYASISASYPDLDWPGFASYQLERVVRHGIRRAAEMRESALTMAELGLEPGRRLADAVADVQDHFGRVAADMAPQAELRRALEAIGKAKQGTDATPPPGGGDQPGRIK
jgi:3-hydroxyisobutyrate dehydrogenase-like beta-hydroxyacid dehydrogenase